MEFKRKSLKLTAEQWAKLDSLADAFEATSPTGTRAGKPSWRTLIKEIADGTIKLSKEDK